MKLFVERDQRGNIKQSQLIIESIDDLVTLRLALDCKIDYCKEWVVICKDTEEKEFWVGELSKYTKAYQAVDVENALELQ